jgi:hypothetical protein
MAVSSLIAVVGVICWAVLLTFVWLLCRAAKRSDETSTYDHVAPMRSDRLPSVAERR